MKDESAKKWASMPILERRAPTGRCGAVLFDALGTLVRLEPPAPRLRAELARTTGVDVGDEAAERGFAAEIALLPGEPHARWRRRRARVAARRLRRGAARGARRRPAWSARRCARPCWARWCSPRSPTRRPRCAALRARGGAASWWSATGTARWRQALDRAGLGELVDGVVSSAEVGRAKPAPGAVPGGAGAGRASEAGDALFVGDSPDTDIEGARAAGIRALLVAREGRGAGRASRRSRRWSACPPYSERGWRPWHPPSRRRTRPSCRRAPSAGRRGPRCSRSGASWWASAPPSWPGPCWRRSWSPSAARPTARPVTVIGTIAQGFCFAGAAWFFASRVAKPRLWHFGLQGARFWPTVGWAALGILTFYVITLVYGALVQPDAEQETVEALGGDQGCVRPDRGRARWSSRWRRWSRSSSSAASSTARCATGCRSPWRRWWTARCSGSSTSSSTGSTGC